MAADDRNKPGEPDRSRVSSEQDHEVGHFAKHHGITEQQARDLIAEYGNDRKKLVAAVTRMKASV